MVRKFKHLIRNRIYRMMALRTALAGGIRLEIRNEADWRIYNDIFADGEYDAAIATLLNLSDEPAFVLDLGANAGFFTSRLAHANARRSVQRTINVKAVEASPALAMRYRSQAKSLTPWIASCEIEKGAVGKRNGTVEVFEFDNHGITSIFRPGGRALTATFVDLDALTAEWPGIDLVKCDIEGAEQMFIENFANLLRRTRILVVEFHREFCDITHCRALLKSYGLLETTEGKDHGNSYVALYLRQGITLRT